MGRATSRRRVLRLDGDGWRHREDALVAEEPLEIQLGGRTALVTMRTPGDDFDLVAGLLVAEGAITAADQLSALRYCPAVRAADPDERYNTVEVVLAAGTRPPESLFARVGYTNSACGVCGKASVETARVAISWPLDDDETRVTPETLYALPDRLRAAQRVFERTGGLHAAGLFAADGTLLCVREDVGRHNAVDKVVGWALRAGRLPLRGHVLMVSGRASFELVQKAAAAGVPVLAAVSAPSALAVRLAEQVGVTVAGFVRGRSANVYTHPRRVALSAGAVTEPAGRAGPARSDEQTSRV
jgi:FdhD protein